MFEDLKIRKQRYQKSEMQKIIDKAAERNQKVIDKAKQLERAKRFILKG